MRTSIKESTMKPSVASRIVGRLKEFTEALENKEVISERFTCRTIVLDLRPTPYDPKLVRRTRELLGASQTVFALLLGVSVKTVSSWEQGTNTPSDMACRFMDEIRRNPGYWVNRLREAAVTKTPPPRKAVGRNKTLSR